MLKRPRGLLSPLRRDKKRDLASGEGDELLASKVHQALMTEGTTPQSSGELPWRTAFGSGLHTLRHQRNEAVLGELARVYVRDALQRWVPEAELIEVTASRSGPTIHLRVRFREAAHQGASEPAQVVSIALEP